MPESTTSPERSTAAVLRLPSARSILTILEGRPAIVLDEWRPLADDQALPERGAVIVSRARARQLGADPQLRLGVRVAGSDDPEALMAELGDLARFALLAVVVPKFTDGRHFSLARLLRERHGFAGELRAVGDVLPDQLFYMRRCGYTAFEVRAGQSLETGLRALQAFSVHYQGGADDPRPLYRRRARTP